MKRTITGLILLALLPTLAVAQTAETKVDEFTVVGTARHIPTATTSAPTTYGTPPARSVEPGLPPERSIEPTSTTTAPTRLEATQRNVGTPGRKEANPWPWKWLLAGAAVVGIAIATSN